jgi:hypothetical protein
MILQLLREMPCLCWQKCTAVDLLDQGMHLIFLVYAHVVAPCRDIVCVKHHGHVYAASRRSQEDPSLAEF